MALTQAQLDALNGKTSLTPDQSATVLGHSTGVMSKLINGAENLLPTAGAIVGGIGGAAVGALAGVETGPGAIGTGYLGGVAGAGGGAAAGEALKEKLQGQQLQGGEIAKQGAINAAFEAVGGPLLSAGGKLLEGTAKPIISTIGKGVSKIADMFGAKPVAEKIVLPPVKLATSRVASTADILTKRELEEASLQGRFLPKGTLKPSETESRAGELLKGKTFSNPIKTQKVIQDEIATKGKGVEKYLGENGRPIYDGEHEEIFQQARDKVSKYLSNDQLKDYDSTVGQFEKELEGMGNLNTGTYYKALKNFEQNVTKMLPKGTEALLTDSGSAKLEGAKAVRTAVRDMIGKKNPEFKQSMFDLTSLYDSLDNVTTRAVDKAKGSSTWVQRNPIKTKALKAFGTGAAGAVGAGTVYEVGKDVLGQ